VSLTQAPLYRSADVEIDAARRCVRRQGHERDLRPQAFDVLLYLVAQRERLISKDELIRAIWHDAAVTDGTLVHCIADIRRALRDDSRDPRFIKTIYKSGYRFIGTIEEAEKTAAARPKRLAVTYFENRSGQNDLAWLREGLADMLITGLVRAGGGEVVTHRPTDTLGVSEATEIARRSRADAVVLGAVWTIGNRIRIEARLHDAQTGQLLTAESVVADRPEEILTQVDALSLKLAAYAWPAPAETVAPR
jgi:DNA-binding winged helix-turn-helix (wHTH) protein